MGALDDHNHQHTYGNSLGPPTSVVGVSAQSAIDANMRLTEAGAQNNASTSNLDWKGSLRLTVSFSLLAFIVAFIAYTVGGIGAVALGLIAAIAGFLAIIFLFITLISFIKSR